MRLCLPVIALCALVSGCAHQLSTIEPERHLHEVPDELFAVATAEVGDEILAAREYEVLPAIELQREVKAGGGLYITCTVPAQRLVAQVQDQDWIYYQGANVTDYDSVLGSSIVMGGIKVRKKEKARNNEAVFCRSNQVSLYPTAKIEYTPMIHRRSVGQGSKHSVSYSGRNNDVLHFLYRYPNEFGEITKSTVELDTERDKKLEIGGAEVEIVSIGENSIQYKVLKRFQPSAAP